MALDLEGFSIKVVDTTPNGELPDDLKGLYFDSLHLDFPSLEELQTRRLFCDTLSGKFLKEDQTRTNQRIVVADFEGIHIASLAVSDVVSSRLSGILGQGERFAKGMVGNKWRWKQLGFFAHHVSNAQDDPKSPNVNIYDIMAYEALRGADRQRVSWYPSTREVNNACKEGDVWLASRVALWGLSEIPEDSQDIEVLPKNAEDEMEPFSFTEHHYTSRMPSNRPGQVPDVLTYGANVRKNILGLNGAALAIGHLLGSRL